MFCPNCGTKNEDDAVFCQNCGANLLEDSQAQQTPVQNVAPQYSAPQSYAPKNDQQQPYGNYGSTATQTPPVQQPYYAASTVPSGAPRKKLSLAQILIPIIIVLVVAAGIISYSVLSNMCSPESVVKNYYQSALDGNWAKMYSYLDIEKLGVK